MTYHFDAANRLTSVAHLDALEQEMVRVVYGWTINSRRGSNQRSWFSRSFALPSATDF